MCERIYTTQEQTIIKNFKLNNPHVCKYCGKQIIGKEVVTVDHKTPVCRGGETVEENLAISCYPCNQEKDDMTIEEYIVYKQKQQEILDDYEVNHLINGLVSYHNSIINRAKEVNDDYDNIEKQIIELQQDIMWDKFNACEGYLYSKKLNELLHKKEELKIKKIGFSRLNQAIGSQREHITTLKAKIQTEVKNANKVYLKKYVAYNCKNKNKKSKIVNIEEYMEVAK